ncbi:DNA primase [Streptomyces sp. NPDC052225]|uniref:DNA primase n=1 Tax=Streptomyces sp. NPDC052225 TaxID=3154949 RepID=UPI00342E6688
MNRAALGLAVGAGYVLGRTKKMKLAFAVGTMVAGKRLKLSPRALADLVSHQLENNPQFKEIGDQLREDLRGVGKAASGALVERQIEGIAGRLHSRTQGVRDQIAGVAPDVDDVRDAGERVTGKVVPGRRRSEDESREDEDEPDDAYEAEDEGDDEAGADHESDADEREEDERPRRRAPARKTAAAKKNTTQQSAAKQGTGGTRGAAKKTARTAKKTAGSASRTSTKGGRGRG